MNSKRKKIFGFASIISPSNQNNPYVQAWLDRGAALGYALPPDIVINALNDFFDAIDSLMPLAEMVKFYALNNATLSQIATLNFVNPLLYQSVLINSPTYDARGFISNGTTSYINGNIATNRRANIQDDFSQMAYGMDIVSVPSVALCGSQITGGFYLVRPGGPVNADIYPFNGASVISSANHKAMFGNYSISSTQARSFRNNAQGAIINAAGLGNALTIFDCSWNNSGSPSNLNSVSHVGFRWEGFQLTNVQTEIIRIAFESYLAAIGL